jgi:5-hydroxyisourate hydrolase
MNATLTTHVLDTARGMPATGLLVSLFHHDGGVRELIGEAATNVDGRTDAPLGAGLAPGVYELVFHVASYFGEIPAFYDEITIRIVLDDDRESYHVPLLLAPYSYSTYRGS